MCGGDDHFAWKRPVSLEVCRGLRTIGGQEIGSQQSRSPVVQDETPHDSLPPPPPLPISTVPQASPYMLHGHSEVVPPVVVQTMVINDAHTCMDHVLRIELEALRQRLDESVSSFISRWRGKIAEIIDRPSEKDQIQPKIARHVVGVPFTNFGSLVLALYDVDDGMPLSQALRKLTEAGLLTALTPRPPPQPVSPQIRMNLHCAYHQGLGHETDRCTALRHAIQDLINQGLVHLGQPSYVIREVRTVWQQPPIAARPLKGMSSNEGVRREDDEILRATCIVFSDDDLPPKGSDHACPLYISVGCSGRRVPSVLLGNGLALNVCHLATAITFGYAPSDFGPSTQTVRAYDSTWREVLRIPTSFSLLLGRPWIHKARPIPFSFYQKVKFIHDGQVITVQSIGDMFISTEPVLHISSSDDDLFMIGFTFDEVQTLEMEDFCRDFVAMSFDQHGSTVVLDMMRSMSYLPDMGLGRHQHRPSEFMAVLDHDVPFGLGFIPTKADYRYMARLRKERFGRLFHGGVKATDASRWDHWGTQHYSAKLQRLVHQLQLGDGAPGTLTSTVVTPSSLDHMSCMTFHFPDEIDEYGTFAEIEDIVDGAIPYDEYINEMLVMSLRQIDETVVEGIQTTPAPEFADDVIVVDELFDGPVGPVEGSSDFVDPPLSFDVLSGFVSRFDDVHDSLFMDLSIFEYLPVSRDMTLSTPFSLTAHIFDIDDEIAQHD
uniref:Uncharacterized protein n=1 Tax=Vitis vinifera TaxID=29760 RepID=A5C8F4_VITVI|nr:hypothetical protein VITISV_004666 [Vitis vinifera]